LQNLSIERTNRPLLVKHSETLQILTQVIAKRDASAKPVAESAMGILQNLSIDETVREEMAKPVHRVVTTLLDLVVEASKLSTSKSEFDPNASYTSDPFPTECEIALATLKNLSITDANKPLFIGEYGVVTPLTDVVRLTQGKPRKLAYQLLRNLPLTDAQVTELCAMFKTLPDAPDTASSPGMTARHKSLTQRFTSRFSIRKSPNAPITPPIEEDHSNQSFMKRISHRFSTATSPSPSLSLKHSSNTLAPRQLTSPTLPFENSQYLASPSIGSSTRTISTSPTLFVTPRTPV
jgi:hypothetical protein